MIHAAAAKFAVATGCVALIAVFAHGQPVPEPTDAQWASLCAQITALSSGGSAVDAYWNASVHNRWAM